MIVQRRHFPPFPEFRQFTVYNRIRWIAPIPSTRKKLAKVINTFCGEGFFRVAAVATRTVLGFLIQPLWMTSRTLAIRVDSHRITRDEVFHVKHPGWSCLPGYGNDVWRALRFFTNTIRPDGSDWLSFMDVVIVHSVSAVNNSLSTPAPLRNRQIPRLAKRGCA